MHMYTMGIILFRKGVCQGIGGVLVTFTTTKYCTPFRVKRLLCMQQYITQRKATCGPVGTTNVGNVHISILHVKHTYTFP